VLNPSQGDADRDGVGDVCDADFTGGTIVPSFRHICLNANTRVVNPTGKIVMTQYFDTTENLLQSVVQEGLVVILDGVGLQVAERLDFPASNCVSNGRIVRPTVRCTGTHGETLALRQRFRPPISTSSRSAPGTVRRSRRCAASRCTPCSSSAARR